MSEEDELDDLFNELENETDEDLNEKEDTNNVSKDSYVDDDLDSFSEEDPIPIQDDQNKLKADFKNEETLLETKTEENTSKNINETSSQDKHEEVIHDKENSTQQSSKEEKKVILDQKAVQDHKDKEVTMVVNKKLINKVISSIQPFKSSLLQDENSQDFKKQFLEIYSKINQFQEKEKLTSQDKKELKKLFSEGHLLKNKIKPK